jgi:ribose/xylose/arabinose/galactoside ABC-type transport system permease subunit
MKLNSISHHALGKLSAIRGDTLFLIATLILIVVVLSALSPSFGSKANVLNIGSQMAMLSLVAIGQTFTLIGGAFDLSQGAQVALHGAVAAIVMVHTDSVTLGIVAGLGAGLLFGLVNGLLITGLRINAFIITLGTSITAQGIVLAATNNRAIIGLPQGIDAISFAQPLGISWIIWVVLVAFLLGAYVLHINPVGFKIFAVGGNREAARLAGIRVDRVTIFTFLASGFFSALAGVCITIQLQTAQPTVGIGIELYSIAAVVLGGTSLFGGRGTIAFTFLGVLLITVIQNGLDVLGVSQAYKQLVIGVIFILAVSFGAMRGRTLPWRRRKAAELAAEPLDRGAMLEVVKPLSMPPANRLPASN